MKIPYIATRYAGCLYRSRTEARWAVFFDACGIRFQYELEGFVIRSGAYLPDFYLPDQKAFLEVKGDEPTDEERTKCAELARAAECDVLLAVDQPKPRFQIIWFDREGEREGRYVIARDRISACGFWLVGEDHANHIGPAARCSPARWTMRTRLRQARVSSEGRAGSASQKSATPIRKG